MAERTGRKGLRDAFAATGVILSLLFVGYEIRQNTAAQQSATIEGLLDQRVELTIAAWTDSDMTRVVRLLREGALGEDLTPDDLQRGRLFLITYIRILEGAWRQVSLGVVDDETYDFFSRGGVQAWPFFHEQWPSLTGSFDPRFVEFLGTEFGL